MLYDHKHYDDGDDDGGGGDDGGDAGVGGRGGHDCVDCDDWNDCDDSDDDWNMFELVSKKQVGRQSFKKYLIPNMVLQI